MEIEVWISRDGRKHTIDVSGLTLGPNDTAALSRRMQAACATVDRPFSARLGWAVLYFAENDPDRRRHLCAALRLTEPGIAGVSFERVGGDIVARFVRRDGRELAERWAVPGEAAPAAPEPAAPVGPRLLPIEAPVRPERPVAAAEPPARPRGRPPGAKNKPKPQPQPELQSQPQPEPQPQPQIQAQPQPPAAAPPAARGRKKLDQGIRASVATDPEGFVVWWKK